MKDQTLSINSLTELGKVGQEMAEIKQRPLLFLLFGQLGSGKTAFTKAFCRACGYDPNQVKSPTFSLINLYQTPQGQKIYHLDLYRLDYVDPILFEEIKEILAEPDVIVLIEWAERLPPNIENHFTGRIISCEFEYLPEKQRLLKVSSIISPFHDSVLKD